MIEVWGRTNSVNVQKVMWAIGELGLPFKRHDAGGAFGGLDTDFYGDMNPNRKIPVLRDGDTIMWESQAIVRYLAARYGQGSLWDIEPEKRIVADCWMEWHLSTLHPVMTPLFWGLIRTAPEDRDQQEIEQAARDILPLWAIFDGHLADREFVSGGQLTMGDIPLGCSWWRYRNLGLDFPAYTHIERWYESLCERQAYRDHVMIEVT